MAEAQRWLIACLIAAGLIAAGVARAQLPSVGDQPALLFSAGEVTYDQTLNIITARGKVEVSQAERVLLADTLTYNRRTNVVTATGNVSLLEPTGDVYFADYVELSDDLRNGVIERIRVLLSNNARIAANAGWRTGGTRTEMTRAVYSPCEICTEDSSRPPFWQIKAMRVIHDQNRQTVEYYDATLELGGVPVAYLPYFSHYDPTVERRSGFLAPTFGSSSNLGLRVETPYFWTVSPSRDATILPITTTKEGLVMAGKYREHLGFGELQLDGSATRDSKDKNRGHLFALGRFSIDDTWRWGFNAERATDDTYLKRYNFSSKRTLGSNLFVEGFRGRDYAQADAHVFQGLREADDPGQTPVVLPRLTFERIGPPGVYGQHTSLKAGAYAITRSDGADSRRLSLGGGWHLPYTAPAGNVYRLSATVQGDLHHANALPDNVTPDERTRNGFKGRVFPQAALDWSYPLLRESGVTSQVIEPLASIVVAPNGGNPPLVPNEDSQDFEFTDANLFSHNRFTGVDRLEGGPRVNYGIQGGVYGVGGGSAGAMIGQSYRLRGDDTFAQGSGLEDNFSDVVGRIFVSPAQFLDFIYRYRLDKNDFRARYGEIGLRVGPPSFNLRLNYILIDRNEQLGEFTDREEISGILGAQLNERWSVAIRGQRDLVGKGDMISSGAELVYENDCFIFKTEVERSFTSDRDVSRDNTIMFRVVFKTLGEIETTAR